ALLVVYLRKAGEAPVKTKALRTPVAEKAVEKPLRADLKAAVKVEEDKDNLDQKKYKANTNAAKPAQEATASEAAKIASAAPKQLSIQELAAAKQAAAEKSVKKAEEENKKASDSSVKGINKKASSEEAVKKQEEPRPVTQATRSQRALTGAEEVVLDEELHDTATKAPVNKMEIPFFKDLPYDFRNSAPKMTINVFVYAERPEERFVVMNMEKYKTGQTTKDAVEIKEIRSDSVVASYGGRTFRIERP
ncbi:MAG TPA: general secretion pathway protein GspB, partial [Methylomicrobium sp.]|nr:general secretion pathway protein GspB [Methylomicrobium sp.]